LVLLSEAGGKNLLQASHLNHSLEDSLKDAKITKNEPKKKAGCRPLTFVSLVLLSEAGG
jgi:hypothetical protein